MDSPLRLKDCFGGVYAGKRVLVTGHTGFKGSWLCEWLLQLGAEVTGFALAPPTNPSLFDQLGLSSRLTHIVGDVRDLERVKRVVVEVQPHFVFHLAAQPLVRLSYAQPVETFAANVMGTVNVLEALRTQFPLPVLVQGLVEPELATSAAAAVAAAPRCVAVMVTTDKCYENKEWVHSYREEDPMGGYDPYSSSKGAAELVIAAYRRSFFPVPAQVASSSSVSRLDLDSAHLDYALPRVCVASARAGNVIGGGDWALDRIVPDCIRALQQNEAIQVRNKVATRPWQHVLEPLSGYLWLAASIAKQVEVVARQVEVASSSSSGGEAKQQASLNHQLQRMRDLCGAINFGPALSSNRTVAELVRTVLKHYPGNWEDKSDPQAVHEAQLLNLSTDKAHHFLGWKPVWDFDQTIAKTVEWYRSAVSRSVTRLTGDQIKDYVAAASRQGVPWINRTEFVSS